MTAATSDPEQTPERPPPGRRPGAAARECWLFAVALAATVVAFFGESIVGGKVLSPADVLRVSASFRGPGEPDYEPANRLLMDPVLQFQPWLEFNRREIRAGRLPVWNPYAGCGAPHLANGQSAVFDPFHLLAYVGTLPDAFAWIAAGRLFFAGLGMYLLARSWGLGFWGRWFAGLVFPFCGFLVLWLLFPVTSAAIWMPWLFLAVDCVFRRPGPRSSALLALASALVLVGGHIQTSAHVLLAGGLYAAWRWMGRESRAIGRPRLAVAWGAGTLLGIGLAAAQIVPLAVYLTRSPVWGERQREAPAWWSIGRPRLLDAACTALPYAFGSQRRGQPNLARALGVHNLNESAGGYAGLATLIWLAPLALRARRRHPRAVFLAALAVVGGMGAYGIPPVDNLLRAIPVLDVTDNRRLGLWLAFGLALLGGVGIDNLARTRRLGTIWPVCWLIAAAALAAAAVAIPRLEPALRVRAVEHYQRAAATESTSPGDRATRALRQVRATVRFLPLYYGTAAAELSALALLAATCRGQRRARRIAPAVFAITLAELASFGWGLNPAIARDDHERVPPVIAHLRRGLAPGARAVGIGEELPPNVLMRFGLSDPRNYDSVELADSVAWLDPIFEPTTGARSSRRDLTWSSAIGRLERLRASGVGAMVGATPPPAGVFAAVEPAGRVWIARLEPLPWAELRAPAQELHWSRQPASATVDLTSSTGGILTVRETAAPGWKASVDGRSAPLERHAPELPFLRVRVPSGKHTIFLYYDPPEVAIGLWISACAAAVVILALTGSRQY